MNNLLVVFGVCILAMYLFKMSKRTKKQRGGINKRALVAILVLVGICSVVGYFVWKHYHKSSPTPSPTPSPSPSAYIKYDTDTKSWGNDKPCTPISEVFSNGLIKLETDQNKKSDGGVICPIPSMNADGTCTGDCVNECPKYYGKGNNAFGPCYIKETHQDGKEIIRGDNKCVVTDNSAFQIYENDKCI